MPQYNLKINKTKLNKEYLIFQKKEFFEAGLSEFNINQKIAKQ